MNEWIRVSDMKPARGDKVLCYCPDWCDTEYQIAMFDGKKFYYEDQPNDMFDGLVVAWSYFGEYQ